MILPLISTGEVSKDFLRFCLNTLPLMPKLSSLLVRKAFQHRPISLAWFFDRSFHTGRASSNLHFILSHFLSFHSLMIPKSWLKNKSMSHLPKSHRPVSLAGLLEFFHMAAEGGAERGRKNSLTIGRDVVLDLLDRFCQLLDQPLT